MQLRGGGVGVDADRQQFQGTDRFEVERFLGRGGFGTVYAVRDNHRETDVAAKVLREFTPDALVRFKREFRGLAGISHPNLVTLHELHAVGDTWFFTMELIRGDSFRRHVRPRTVDLNAPTFDLNSDTTLLDPEASTSGKNETVIIPIDVHGSPPPDVDLLRCAFGQLAQGIHALHRAGKLHRDLKPSNALVQPDGRVVLLDFGLVTDFGGADERSDNVLGTPLYVGPEQMSGAEPGPASDWYSLGVMLYEALTGFPPFRGTMAQILWAKQGHDGPDPREMVKGLPDDLSELARALMQRDISKRPGPARIFEVLGIESDDTPVANAGFVGREEELRRMQEAYMTSIEGQLSVVSVSGASGVGKSTLVTRFLTGLEPQPLLLLGRCYERESVPFKALDSLIDMLAAYLRELPADEVEPLIPQGIHSLSQLFPALLRVHAIATAGGSDSELLDPGAKVHVAAGAMRRLLWLLARKMPVVLSIDDTQWGDPDSAALLSQVFIHPRPPPVLLISTHRSSGAEQPVPALLRELPGAEQPWQLQLQGLNRGEAQALLSLLGEGLDTEITARMADESGGHPQFLEEMVHLARTRPDLPDNLTLNEVIAIQVRELSDQQRLLTELVAVAGQPIPRPVLRTALASTDADVGIAAIESFRLIRAGSDDQVETYHDRIRETVVDMLSPSDLAQRHLLLAQALAAAGFLDPQRLLVHSLGAGRTADAARYALVAANNATHAMAFAHAVELYRIALDLETIERDDAMRARERLASALANAGRCPEASSVYLECAAEAEDPLTKLDLRRQAAELYMSSGHVEAGLGVVRTLLTDLGITYPATSNQALYRFALGRMRTRLRGLKFTTRHQSDVPRDALIRLDALWAVATGLSITDNLRGGVFQTQALEVALDAGEPKRLVRAFTMECAYRALAGKRDDPQVKLLLDMARDVVEEHPHEAGRALLSLTSGVVSNCLAEYGTSLTHLHRAEAILGRCTDVNWELNTARLFIIDGLRWSGRFADLALELNRLTVGARASGNLLLETCVVVGNASLFVGADDPDQARDTLDANIQKWPNRPFQLQHWWHASASCDVEQYAGKPERALEIAQDAWRQIKAAHLDLIKVIAFSVRAVIAANSLAVARKQTGWARWKSIWTARWHMWRASGAGFVNTPATMATLHAQLAAIQGNTDEQLRQLVIAHEAYEDLGFPLHAAICQRRRGRCLKGDKGQAMVVAAEEALRGQGVADPKKICQLLFPI